ncbi:MRC1-like domain-containing protein [Cladochytrium replicatum]|nr:MRC1-like domain-containing protein [Cladochytrium replicatum]
MNTAEEHQSRELSTGRTETEDSAFVEDGGKQKDEDADLNIDGDEDSHQPHGARSERYDRDVEDNDKQSDANSDDESHGSFSTPGSTKRARKPTSKEARMETKKVTNQLLRSTYVEIPKATCKFTLSDVLSQLQEKPDVKPLPKQRKRAPKAEPKGFENRACFNRDLLMEAGSQIVRRQEEELKRRARIREERAAKKSQSQTVEIKYDQSEIGDQIEIECPTPTMNEQSVKAVQRRNDKIIDEDECNAIIESIFGKEEAKVDEDKMNCDNDDDVMTPQSPTGQIVSDHGILDSDFELSGEEEEGETDDGEHEPVDEEHGKSDLSDNDENDGGVSDGEAVTTGTPMERQTTKALSMVSVHGIRDESLFEYGDISELLSGGFPTCPSRFAERPRVKDDNEDLLNLDISKLLSGGFASSNVPRNTETLETQTMLSEVRPDSAASDAPIVGDEAPTRILKKKKSKKPRSMFVEQEAHESDDEFKGLGGSDGDFSSDDDEELVMSGDEEEITDFSAVVELHRAQMQEQDEAEIRELMNDVTSGNLRKRAAHRESARSGKGFELSDSEEENELLLRKIRKRSGKRRKQEGGDDGATFQFFECFEVDCDEKDGFLSDDSVHDESAEESPTTLVDEPQEQDLMIDDSHILKLQQTSLTMSSKSSLVVTSPWEKRPSKSNTSANKFQGPRGVFTPYSSIRVLQKTTKSDFSLEAAKAKKQPRMFSRKR